MGKVLVTLLLAAGACWSQTGSEACCKCDLRASAVQPRDVICLGTKEMSSQVDHIEPLKPSGLGKGLNLSGTVVVEVRFDADGKVVCSRAKSGHPIAIAAAIEAIPKWTFKPLTSNGVAKAGCGRIPIKYRLRDRGSSTELQ